MRMLLRLPVPVAAPDEEEFVTGGDDEKIRVGDFVVAVEHRGKKGHTYRIAHVGRVQKLNTVRKEAKLEHWPAAHQGPGMRRCVGTKEYQYH